MPQTIFENRALKPARFVEICALDEPYFYATRREGEVGTWGEWDMLSGEAVADFMPWEMGEMWEQVVEAVKNDLGDDWAIVEQRSVPAFTPTSQILEERYGVELPERLATFFDDGEWEAYQGLTTHDPPMWSTSFQVAFDNPGVHMNWEMVEIPDDSDRERFVALTPLLGGETTEFLAAKIDDPNVPVAMWYHGSGTFYEYHDSLDEFLEALE